MNRVFGAGLGLSAIGVAGYLYGIAVSYPGRAFSITAIMAGITFVAIGRAKGARREWP